MVLNKVLIPFVAVLDSDISIARLTAKAINQSIDNVQVEAFQKPNDAWKKIKKTQKLEPYVIITDWIGTEPRKLSFVSKVRTNYPKTQIILYSGRATLENIVRLQNTEGLIDKYLHKDDGLKRLRLLTKACFDKYSEDPILSSVRFYLSHCKKPQAPFTVLGNKEYSLVDLYWEIVKGSDVGKVTQEAWQLILSNAVFPDMELD